MTCCCLWVRHGWCRCRTSPYHIFRYESHCWNSCSRSQPLFCFLLFLLVSSVSFGDRHKDVVLFVHSACLQTSANLTARMEISGNWPPKVMELWGHILSSENCLLFAMHFRATPSSVYYYISSFYFRLCVFVTSIYCPAVLLCFIFVLLARMTAGTGVCGTMPWAVKGRCVRNCYAAVHYVLATVAFRLVYRRTQCWLWTTVLCRPPTLPEIPQNWSLFSWNKEICPQS